MTSVDDYAEQGEVSAAFNNKCNSWPLSPLSLKQDWVYLSYMCISS